MNVKVTYYLEVLSSWCYWAEPTWAELKLNYAGKVEFGWKIAQMPAEAYPVSREQCEWFYRRSGAIMRSPYMLNSGWFEPVAKPWGVGGVPKDLTFGTLPPDFDHIEPLIEMATERMPVLGQVGIQLFFNGPESFTPDDRYLLGESPDVKGLWVAAGFNSIGIQSSGGAGKVLADWIIDGEEQEIGRASCRERG